VPKSRRLLAHCTAVQSFRKIYHVAARDGLAAVVFQNLNELPERIERDMRGRLLASGVDVTRCVNRALDCALRNLQNATQSFHMLRFEGFGVGESVLVVQPNPKRGLRNLNPFREFADRNSQSISRGIDQFLEGRMGREIMDQTPARRNATWFFALRDQARHPALYFAFH
jgi:hypothetical protein